jgi:para-nitrobenzyl esterase
MQSKSFWVFVFTIYTFLLYSQVVVNTLDGKVGGYTEQGINIFKGVPFAAPPIGNYRWKNPQPTVKWKGVKDCTRFSASPIQGEPKPFMCWSEEFIAKPEPLSEDCLYLNVWTPANKSSTKLPVMVWIYGGGLSSGSANCDIYDGTEMAKQGIVFVSINYRVGIMGFMAHPELSKESSNKTSGNYGFHDQIAALKWVKNNIAKFNGDPNNVTIAGQSAGAFSVNVLIASQDATDLFHKAIPQSGGILSNRLTQDKVTSEKQGLQVMENAKAKSINDLRKMSAAEIYRLSEGNVGRFGITLDNQFLPLDLMAHFKNGKHNKVPILTGWVTGDGGLFGESNITLETYKKEVSDKYKKNNNEYMTLFPANNDDDAKKMKSLEALIGFAGLPSHLLASFTPEQPAYFYQFGHVPPDKPNFPNYGAFHTSEVPYALHTLHLWNRPWQQIDKELETTMSKYWVNFVKTGNPNGENLLKWEPYTKENGHILLLNDKIKCEAGLFKKQFDFLVKSQTF